MNARQIVKQVKATHGVSDKSIQAEYFESTHEIYNALLDFIDEYDLTEDLAYFLNCNVIEDNK